MQPTESLQKKPGFGSRVSGGLRRRLRRLSRPLVRKLAQLGQSRPSIASLYYVLCSSAFSREHRAVLHGKKLFQEHIDNPGSTSSLLRRNIHRIEKGLVSRPRRDVFAADYILETVDVYARCLTLCSPTPSPELAWACDVLTQYFAETGSHENLDQARSQFQGLPRAASEVPPDRATDRAPYHRQIAKPAPVTFESLLHLAQQRRSVRWFQDRPVPRDLLLKAAEVASQSPSACNRQPFQFRVFDDEPLLRKVAALPAGTAGYHHNFPCVAVVIGRQRYYFHERDRHLIYIDGSLATMSFILALETLGLSSCCINWPDIEERETAAAELLDLEADERPIMFLAIGYPDPTGMVPYSEKRLPTEICRFASSESDA